MPEWLTSYLPEGWNGWHLAIAGVVLGITSAAICAVVVTYVIARVPADYFSNPETRNTVRHRHPILRVLLIVGRNLFGYLLIAIGIILSLPGVPGQGLLTVLMGVMLIDFPGKFHAERWLVSRRLVRNNIDRVRKRIGQPPLILDHNPPSKALSESGSTC